MAFSLNFQAALCAADSSPRTSQRKAGSDIAPLLQPRPESSTEQQGRGTRIPLGGVAGRLDRPELHGAAGEFRSISERPCRGARQVPQGCPSLIDCPSTLACVRFLLIDIVLARGFPGALTSRAPLIVIRTSWGDDGQPIP